MSWVDVASITLDIVTLLFVLRATQDIKSSLSDARHERLDINRRLEVLSRRVDKQYQQAGMDPSAAETFP